MVIYVFEKQDLIHDFPFILNDLFQLDKNLWGAFGWLFIINELYFSFVAKANNCKNSSHVRELLTSS